MLRDTFQDQLKQAMHAKDELATSTIRLILAALQDRDIALRGKGNWDGIGDDEILSMLQSMIKQRRESIKMYEVGKRFDLVEREAAEIKVIERFLPAQLSDEDIRAAIDACIAETGAAGVKDMGKVIAELKKRHAGQMDFSKASGMVKDRLLAAAG